MQPPSAPVRLQAPASPPAPIPAKRDILVLAYGDRLRGEIKALSRGRLSFDVKAAGVISVKWDYVAELTSVSIFLVETNEGAQVVGTLPPAGPGKLAVATAATRWDFDLGSVVSIVPIRRSFLQRLDGSINLGGSYTQSSGVAQLSVHLQRESPAAGVRVADQRRGLPDLRERRRDERAVQGRPGLLARRHRALGGVRGGQVERNPDLGFDFRGTSAAGLERTLLRSNRSFLSVRRGPGGVPRGAGGRRQRDPPARAATLRHSFYTYDTPKTSVETTFTALPILNQSGRWRMEANASVSREVFKDFSVAVTFYESYDNRPPSAEANKNDAGATALNRLHFLTDPRCNIFQSSNLAAEFRV